MSATRFIDRLCERIRAGTPPAVVGLDPRPNALPNSVAPDAPAPERFTAFYREAIPVLADHIPVLKPNIAFFEAYGSAGYAAYEEVCAMAREAGLLVLGDIKRGDIGSTAEAYAHGHLQIADAITLNPYLGSDSLAPYLSICREEGQGLFVLVRTSNPSARELQALETRSGTVSEMVARLVHAWGMETAGDSGWSSVGAVVGATAPDQINSLRQLMPKAFFLLPGVGAQGASVEDVATAFDERGEGALVAQSRGILQCFQPDDAGWKDKVHAAAEQFAAELRATAFRGSAAPKAP